MLAWIVLSDQPFTAIEDQSFVDLVQTLNPDATLVSDTTIRSDLQVAYDTKFSEMKATVAAIPGKISLTMDGWSAKNLSPFIAIRGHWLNENWEYCSKIFDFAHAPDCHSGETQCNLLANCLSRLGIPFSKILGITVDNATNNNTLFEFLEKNYGLGNETEHHVRCLAHILNLSVQDILHALKVPDSIPDDNSDCDLDKEVCSSTIAFTMFTIQLIHSNYNTGPRRYRLE